MPMPWAALATILRQAPVVLAGAEALLARTRKPPTTAADLETLRKRIGDLEQHQQATATLAKELAEQAHAIAAAMQADSARTRQAFILSLAATIVAVIGLVVAILRG